MIRLRPGVIAVMLSLCGSGAIGPASGAPGSEPARANDAATLGAAERSSSKSRCARSHQALLPMSFVGGENSQGGPASRQPQRMDEGGRQWSGGRPGAPEKSLLIEAIRYESLEMPPRGKLPDAEIAVLERWVRMGAPDPRTDTAPTGPSRADLDAGRSHWAFRPIAKPPVPRVKDIAWPRSDVDRFILAKLESEGLTPVADADRPTWLRRVFFDLVGIPPTPAEIESFLADDAPDAFSKVVDALLGRPEFGQRWGRHWLDVRALCRLQRVGRELHLLRRLALSQLRDRRIQRRQAIRPVRSSSNWPATCSRPAPSRSGTTTSWRPGSSSWGPRSSARPIRSSSLVDVIDEQVDTIGKAFLGLTIGCARCHDHKFDPISARDYYALAGILASTETIHGNLLNRRDLTGWNLHPLGSGGQAAYEAFLAHEKSLDGRMKEQKELQARRDALKKGANPPMARNRTRRSRRCRRSQGRTSTDRGTARRAEAGDRETEGEPSSAPAAGDVRERSRASRPDRDLHSRRCSQPGRDGSSRVRRDRRAPLAGHRAGCQRPGAARRVAHQRPESAHQPGGREPSLAAPVRTGAGRHAGRLRHARRAPLEPGASRPSGPAIHATGLVVEAIDPRPGA